MKTLDDMLRRRKAGDVANELDGAGISIAIGQDHIAGFLVVEQIVVDSIPDLTRQDGKRPNGGSRVVVCSRNNAYTG